MNTAIPRAFGILSATLLFLAGCEGDSGLDSVDLRIHASDSELWPGESVSLHASTKHDSDDVYWSLANPDIGRLSSTRGHTVSYTAVQSPEPGEPDFKQVVYCKAESRHADSLLGDHHASLELRHTAGRKKTTTTTSTLAK